MIRRAEPPRGDAPTMTALPAYRTFIVVRRRSARRAQPRRVAVPAARYNIVSLTVGRTERRRHLAHDDRRRGRRRRRPAHRGESLQARERPLRRGHDDAATVTRELALIKVRAGATSRGEVMRLCDVFRARVVDVGPRRSSWRSPGRREDRRPGRGAAALRRDRDGADGRGRDAAQRRGSVRERRRERERRRRKAA